LEHHEAGPAGVAINLGCAEQTPRIASFRRTLGLVGDGGRLRTLSESRRFPMRSLLLWAVGVPIPIIVLLWFFMR
jgi:hypothetical protein